MAHFTQGKCNKCGNKFQTMVNSGMSAPDLCDECQKEKEDIQRREYFHGLDGLTIEERLRRIEEWIYDYKPYKKPRF